MVPREQFNGTDDEYYQASPGQFMDNWMTEFSTKTLVRLTDEFNTPESPLPQYLVGMFDENVSLAKVKPDSLYKHWVERYALKYYDKLEDFIVWDKSRY